MGRRAKPAKVKAKANRPPARKSRKDEGIKVRDREKRLAEALQREAAAAKREAEALEQQAATSKILELISSARTDVTPVFDAIAENAVRLCDASLGALLRFDGQMIHLAAHAHQDADSLQALQTMYPMPVSR